MGKKDQSPIIEWDTCSIIQNQADFLIENGEADNKDTAWNMAASDQDLFTFEWDYLLENLSEKLDEINPEGYWYCEVKNFGWRNLNGWNNFNSNNGQEFLRQILPDTDCTFRIYIDEDNTIRIQNFHHDSPTGNEWYTLTRDKQTEKAA